MSEEKKRIALENLRALKNLTPNNSGELRVASAPVKGEPPGKKLKGPLPFEKWNSQNRKNIKKEPSLLATPKSEDNQPAATSIWGVGFVVRPFKQELGSAVPLQQANGISQSNNNGNESTMSSKKVKQNAAQNNHANAQNNQEGTKKKSKRHREKKAAGPVIGKVTPKSKKAKKQAASAPKPKKKAPSKEAVTKVAPVPPKQANSAQPTNNVKTQAAPPPQNRPSGTRSDVVPLKMKNSPGTKAPTFALSTTTVGTSSISDTICGVLLDRERLRTRVEQLTKNNVEKAKQIERERHLAHQWLRLIDQEDQIHRECEQLAVKVAEIDAERVALAQMIDGVHTS